MISAIVLTKNEEKNIQACIESLEWCDEIIVIDDFSKDKTVDIAHILKAKVYQRKLDNDFASQRNFGLEKARGDWILFIDADERVSPSLANEIKGHLGSGLGTTPRGFYVKRQDFMWGRMLKHGESGKNTFIRLGKKGAGIWSRRVHETWNIENASFLTNPLLHYPHQTLREFVADIERYSSIHAEENYKEGKRANLFKIIWYPKLKFFQNYFLRGGILDGGAGFIVAMLMSFHSYLAWSKLWTLQKNER